MAVIAAIFSDHFLFTFFFFELQVMMGLLHLSTWMFLPLTVACLLWGPGIGFSLHYHEIKIKRERDNKLYFGEGGD